MCPHFGFTLGFSFTQAPGGRHNRKGGQTSKQQTAAEQRPLGVHGVLPISHIFDIFACHLHWTRPLSPTVHHSSLHGALNSEPCSLSRSRQGGSRVSPYEHMSKQKNRQAIGFASL